MRQAAWQGGRLFCYCTVAYLTVHTVQEGIRTVEDMKVAMEVERPIRTRNDLEDLLVVGPAYVVFNTNFIKRYIGCLPLLCAVPSMVGVAQTFWGMKSSVSALVMAGHARVRDSRDGSIDCNPAATPGCAVRLKRLPDSVAARTLGSSPSRSQ